MLLSLKIVTIIWHNLNWNFKLPYIYEFSTHNVFHIFLSTTLTCCFCLYYLNFLKFWTVSRIHIRASKIRINYILSNYILIKIIGLFIVWGKWGRTRWGVFKIKMIQALCFPFNVFYCIFESQVMVYTLFALLYDCWFKLYLKKY